MTSTTAVLGINTSPMGLARGLSGTFGLLCTATGLYGLFRPIQYSNVFGFNPTSQIVQNSAGNAFIPVAGGRLLSTGLALLGCVVMEIDKAMGVLMCAGFVTGLCDGLGVVWYTDKKDAAAKKAIAGHWGIPSICGAVGLWMLANAET